MREIPGVARDVLVGLLMSGEEHRAQDMVQALVAQGASPPLVISELLGPAMATVGQQWQDGQVSIAQEHRATAIAEGILGTLLAGVPRPRAGQRVWLTGVEGEWHTLPARLVAGVWQCLGWEVVSLTPSLPADELRGLADADPSTLAGVSCSLAANLVPAWETISALRAAGFRVIAGGRGFQVAPGLATVLGADAHVHDPIAASATLAQWAHLAPYPQRSPTRWEEWLQVREVWHALPALVEDATWLARELADMPVADDVLRMDLTLIARTAVAAVLCGQPLLLSTHLQWYTALGDPAHDDRAVRIELLSCLERVLPPGDAVREVLAAC